MPMATGKKTYFASDMHLGMYPKKHSRNREIHIVRWLEKIREDAGELWLLGDIFDYWFEYRKVVPRGFIRFIGKLAELADDGVKIHMFTGNHDVWFFSYFPEEIGATIHRDPVTVKMNNKTLFLSHGDGLTKNDRGYLLLKSVFRSKFLQWCYARIHPNGAAAFAQWWSKKSRYSKEMAYPYKGDDNEEQIIFARQKLKETPEIDYFVFGHRHLPFDMEIEPGKHAICLGDWISNFTYGVFDGESLRLESFVPPKDLHQ
jgi:UDP-2,3-diacylglucosamine hydrolase